MGLDLTGKETRETLERLEAKGENAVEGTVEAEGEDVRATVEVSHTSARWSLAAAAEWARSKGWGVSGKGKWRFGR